MENAANLFQRPDKTYFFQNGDQLIDVTPLITSVSNNPGDWTYVDGSGKIYTPRRGNAVLGEITQDNRSAGRKFWDNYVGKLKYNINNGKVIGGEYTLPAIALGALGMYAAGSAAGGATMPAFNEAIGLVGKNVYGDAARNFALSMLGGGVVDNATKLTTGQSWGKNISDITLGWVPEALGDFTNPGYLFSGEAGNAAVNSAKDALQYATRKVSKPLRYLYKQATAGKRAASLERRMKDFYSLLKSEYMKQKDNIAEQRHNVLNEMYSTNDQYDKLFTEYKRGFKAAAEGTSGEKYDMIEDIILDFFTRLRSNSNVSIKDAKAADTMEQILNDSYAEVPDFSKMSAGDIVKFINKNAPVKPKINLTKGTAENITKIPEVEKFIGDINSSASSLGLTDLALKMLLENGGYTVTPSGNIVVQKDLIPFSLIFKTGDFSIPKFGTNQVVGGTVSVLNPGKIVETNPIDVIRSISDKRILPRLIDYGSSQYSAQVPDQLKGVLQHNIEYLKEMFPGAKPFGSSTTSAYASTPHVTHDIDLLLTDKDFAAQVEKRFGTRDGRGWSVSSKPNNTGYEDTYTHSLGKEYGDAGNIDFNIVYTDPDTGMASSQMGTRGLELFKLFFPADYKAAVMESMRTNTPIKINKTPRELIEAYDPTVKTILDALSSNKAKHVPRAEAHLTTTDPKYVSRALDLYAQEKLGGQALRMPTTRDMFADVEQNRRIFDELGYKGVDKETVVNDPEKMKNLVDYWYIHNSIFGRGISTGDISAPAGTPQQMKAIDDSFRQWVGMRGNANGAGLNTVALADSGHGDVYGYIQPKLNFGDALIAEELVQSAKRQLGHYSYKFTDSEKQQIEEILNKYGQSIFSKGVDTPQDLLASVYTDIRSKEALLEISDKLGIRALSKEALYDHTGRYNSMTGDVTAEDAVMYLPKKLQESPVSDVIRDRNTVLQNSRDDDELKQEMLNLANRRWKEMRMPLFTQNRLYRKRKEFDIHKVMSKYDDMTNEQFNKFAERKVKKDNPGLFNRKQQLEAEVDDLENQSNSIIDKIISSELRLKQSDKIGSIELSVNKNLKTIRDYAALTTAVTLPIGGTMYVAKLNDKFNKLFQLSEEFSLLLKDPRYDKAVNSDDDSFSKLYDEYKKKYRKRMRRALRQPKNDKK